MKNSEQFSFLVTTDNHMGFKQDDHIRRKDSFMAFAEALQIARQKDVDFVLLGGDLFHTNKPSSTIEHKCIKIIRQHMNAHVERGASFRKIQGNFSHFEHLSHANFEDLNLKVPYPIMTIHGNHDDPTGPSAKSVCEKLATCGLLNYFGVVPSIKEKFTIEPIVLEKNGIKIALYGIGFIPDQKLKAAFDRNDVLFSDPPSDSFNVLVVHQNRVPYNKNKYIPDELFPKFFHLIIRGHEHDFQAPQKIPDSKVDGLVYQPGSTVATSISPIEAGLKKVGLITVTANCKMSYELISLQCYRTILFKDIPQREVFNHIKSTGGSRKMTPIDFRRVFRNYVTDRIDGMLKEYELKRKELLVSQEKESQSSSSTIYDKLHRFNLPLVRVRLEYKSKAERFEDLELALSYFPSRVANRDIILFKKQKLRDLEDGQTENVTFASLNDDHDDDDVDDFDVIDLGEEKRDTIDLMIFDYFTGKPDQERLQALSLDEYTNAVRGAKEDGNVISKVLNKKKMEMLRKFKAALTSEEVAERSFHDEAAIQDWMLKAFRGVNQGGDEDLFDDDDDVMFVDFHK